MKTTKEAASTINNNEINLVILYRLECDLFYKRSNETAKTGILATFTCSNHVDVMPSTSSLFLDPLCGIHRLSVDMSSQKASLAELTD